MYPELGGDGGGGQLGTDGGGGGGDGSGGDGGGGARVGGQGSSQEEHIVQATWSLNTVVTAEVAGETWKREVRTRVKSRERKSDWRFLIILISEKRNVWKGLG